MGARGGTPEVGGEPSGDGDVTEESRASFTAFSRAAELCESERRGVSA